MNKKLIDCFMFYNELDILNFRLDYLYDLVDKFILVEATLTQMGNPKELYYNNNKELFKKYEDKIIHIIVEDLPTLQQTTDPWVRENMQRRCMIRGIKQISLNDDDLLIITDLDEIPDRNKIREFKKTGLDNLLYNLQLDVYWYNFNITKGIWGYQPKIINYYMLRQFNYDTESIRSRSTNTIIKKGGWHLSYFGDEKFIINKLINCADQFYDPNYITEENVKKNIELCKDFRYENCDPLVYKKISENDFLPETYLILSKYIKDY